MAYPKLWEFRLKSLRGVAVLKICNLETKVTQWLGLGESV